MRRNNLLLIGSESHVCQDYVNRYKDTYDTIVGIDFPAESGLEHYLSVDFREDGSYEKIAHFLADLDKQFSQIVFAVGVNPMNDVVGVTIKDWDTTFDVNVKAALFSLKSAYDYFSPQTAIVLIASQNGVVGHSQRIDYGTSKSALIHLAKNLSVDYAKINDKDIRVNAVSPSYIATEENKDLLDSYFGKRLLARIPYRRFVSLEDVSHSLHFLLGEGSRSMRGQNLILDYGYTIV